MPTLPQTMKAVVLTGHGGLDKLQYTDVPVPSPGPGEVLIEVRGCGMNNTDVWVREGAYGTDEDPDAVASWRRGAEPTLVFPRIQGTDTAGYIVAVGDGVCGWLLEVVLPCRGVEIVLSRGLEGESHQTNAVCWRGVSPLQPLLSLSQSRASFSVWGSMWA